MNHRAFKIRAALAVGLLSLAGCGGGGGGGGGGDVAGGGGDGGGGGLVEVNGFNFASNIVNRGNLDSAEPTDINDLVLSTSDTEEPDPRA